MLIRLSPFYWLMLCVSVDLIVSWLVLIRYTDTLYTDTVSMARYTTNLLVYLAMLTFLEYYSVCCIVLSIKVIKMTMNIVVFVIIVRSILMLPLLDIFIDTKQFDHIVEYHFFYHTAMFYYSCL